MCLSAAQQRTVAASLVAATRGIGIERHLALLPLAVLLENIAGVRAPLAAGATCCVPSLGTVGVGGSTGFDPRVALGALERWQADSVILLPQMLAALTAVIEAGAPRPLGLRFAAVGGAKVSPALIERARAAGIPAYEGYGLSECASVVALNVPGANRPGSVGRPLPHARVRIDSGEVVVDDAGFLGYLGAARTGPRRAAHRRPRPRRCRRLPAHRRPLQAPVDHLIRAQCRARVAGGRARHVVASRRAGGGVR